MMNFFSGLLNILLIKVILELWVSLFKQLLSVAIGVIILLLTEFPCT